MSNDCRFKKARRTLPAADSANQPSGLFSGISLTGTLTQQNGHPQSKPPVVFSGSTQPPRPLPGTPYPTIPLPGTPYPTIPLPGTPYPTTPLPGTPYSTNKMCSYIISPFTASKPTFLSELRNLNTSVNDWISKHVRENPYVDLTPIFRYKVYIQ